MTQAERHELNEWKSQKVKVLSWELMRNDKEMFNKKLPIETRMYTMSQTIFYLRTLKSRYYEEMYSDEDYRHGEEYVIFIEKISERINKLRDEYSELFSKLNKNKTMISPDIDFMKTVERGRSVGGYCV